MDQNHATTDYNYLLLAVMDLGHWDRIAPMETVQRRISKTASYNWNPTTNLRCIQMWPNYSLTSLLTIPRLRLKLKRAVLLHISRNDISQKSAKQFIKFLTRAILDYNSCNHLMQYVFITCPVPTLYRHVLHVFVNTIQHIQTEHWRI